MPTHSGVIVDANHRGNGAAKLIDPGMSLFASEIALGSEGVLRHNSCHGLEMRGPADQQYFVGETVVVNSERHFSVPGKRFELRRFGWGAQHEFLSIPMKPDGHHPGCSIGPDIS